MLYRVEGAQHGSNEIATEADLHNLPHVDSRTTPPPSSVSPPASSAFLEPQTANVIDLKILSRPRPPLLRLKKAVPHLLTVKDQFQNLLSGIAPLLPSAALLEQTLVILPQDLVAQLNGDLKALETSASRPDRRWGSYLATDERHALLVEGMSTQNSSSEVILEFKPKWLVQSPTAPKRARRCRTCALRTQRAGLSLQNQDTRLVNRFCPLDLASGDREAVEYVVRNLLRQQSTISYGGNIEDLTTWLTEHLVQSDVLRGLKDAQAKLDPQGVLTLDKRIPIPEDFLKATALRDCTMFLKVDSQGLVEAKLADLDLKVPEKGKVDYWRGVEQKLIDEGFYIGADGLYSGCRLERSVALAR